MIKVTNITIRIVLSKSLDSPWTKARNSNLLDNKYQIIRLLINFRLQSINSLCSDY
jgi:hypothetical protein